MGTNKLHIYDGAAETVPCKYGEPFAPLPTSFLLAAPTASGKTIVILNILLRYYKDAFARIWFFSPSIKLDPQYAPLRKYLEKQCPDQRKEPNMFEDLDQAALGKILDEQRLICEDCRKKKRPIPQVCVVLDDLADRQDLLQKRSGGSSGGSWLVTLATRGRHFGVTWIISSQVINLVGTVLRKNVRCMCVWRLRSHKEVEVLCEELSGVYDAKTMMNLYRAATEEPYSFMFCRLDAKTRRDMFFLRFESRLLPEDSGDIESDNDDQRLPHSSRGSQPLRGPRPREGAEAEHSEPGAGKKQQARAKA
jgi:hypothetical protein